ncbi:oligosaccharide repeat unit polymerase [Paenibacillus athensensis]|uniref:O-antigen polymerase n=1 Tax=Paenibacillus athensensis TaxID=1967502 RepID=UPI0014310A50|nr:O-antigen polymerase [Paenibacillus athensensis]MCD1258757.1 oligosaccharide repeat unit polymerase [Paenibacillus athensensis]
MLIIFGFIVFNYFRFQDPLYPPVLQAGVWFFVLLLFEINKSTFIPVSYSLYGVIIAGVYTFSLGSFVGTLGFARDKGRQPLVLPKVRANVASWIIFWLPVVGFPLFVLRALAIGGSGPTGVFFIDLRLALSRENDPASFGVFAYLVTISFISLAIEVYKHISGRNRLRLAFAALLATAYALLATGRTYIMLPAVMIVGLLLITRKLSPLKGLLYFVIFGLISFAVMGLIFNKGVDLESSYTENVTSITDSLKIYMLGSLPAFDQYMQSDVTFGYGGYMFRFFFALLDAVGIHADVPALIQSYQQVPMLTNVYTIYQTYYADFSLVGVVLIQFLLGCWHSLLYVNAAKGKLLYMLLYAFFLYPLFMQFFQDQYFNLLSTWLQIILLLVPYCLLQTRSRAPHLLAEGSLKQ